MKPNVGLLDRYIRLVTGLVILGTGSQMKRGSTLARGTMLTLGAMKVAEGITGFCPVMYACNASTADSSQNSSQQSQDSSQHSKKSESGTTSNEHKNSSNSHNNQSSSPNQRGQSDSNVKSSSAVNEAFAVGSENEEDTKSATDKNLVHA